MNSDNSKVRNAALFNDTDQIRTRLAKRCAITRNIPFRELMTMRISSIETIADCDCGEGL